MVQVPMLPADLAKKEEEDFNATYDVSVGHGAINDEKVRVEYLERGVEVMEPAEGDNIVHIVGSRPFHTSSDLLGNLHTSSLGKMSRSNFFLAKSTASDRCTRPA